MRIEDKPEDQYSLFSRFMFWLQKRKYKNVMLPTKAWGRSSWLYFSFSLFFTSLTRKKSPIAPTLRALVSVYVSQLNQCPFCIDLNASFLKEMGISEEKALAAKDYSTNNQFTATERIALQYTEEITLSDKQVSNNTFEKLQNHFNEDAIIELTAIISFQNLSSKFNAALDIPSQGLCQLPEDD